MKINGNKGTSSSSTKVCTGSIFRGIVASPSKGGQITHVGYKTLNNMIRLGRSGKPKVYELSSMYVVLELCRF